MGGRNAGREGRREGGREAVPVPTFPLSGGKEKMVMARCLSLFCLRERLALRGREGGREGRKEVRKEGRRDVS
jgi:hypothetical protein